MNLNQYTETRRLEKECEKVPVVNIKTGAKAVLWKTWLGKIIFKEELAPRALLKNHKDKLVYQDQPEFKDWEEILPSGAV